MRRTRDVARYLRRVPTVAERRLWEALRGHQLDGAQFRRQHPVGTFIADFYCHEARLVVEVDGEVHLEPRQAEWDRDRDDIFHSLGLRVLRLTNADVLDHLDTALDRIRIAIRESHDNPF